MSKGKERRNLRRRVWECRWQLQGEEGLGRTEGGPPEKTTRAGCDVC